jgi:hypothetical protein
MKELVLTIKENIKGMKQLLEGYEMTWSGGRITQKVCSCTGF